jgi:hypothetical protein
MGIKPFVLLETTVGLACQRPGASGSGGLGRISRQPFQCDLQRAHAKERQERHASESRTVHNAESHVFARLRVELHCFPDERVVSAKDMMSGSNRARSALAKEQRCEPLSIE